MTARWLMLTFALWLLPAFAFAGVTIHYQGKAKNREAIAALQAQVETYSTAHGWRTERIDPAEATSVRPHDDAKTGWSGVVVYVDNRREPLRLEFDQELVMKNFVKTQFCGAERHKQIIEILRQVEPLFVSLAVEDEGGYWDNGDEKVLSQKLDEVSDALRTLKLQRPDVMGPIRLENGLILDLVSAGPLPQGASFLDADQGP